MDSPEGNFNTCFYLAFKGTRLQDSTLLTDIQDFDLNHPAIAMVTDEFNEREVRIQIARLREILTGFKSSTSSSFGIDVGISYLQEVSGSYDINPSAKAAKESDDSNKSLSHPFSGHSFELSKSAEVIAGLLPEVSAGPEDPCLKSLTVSCWNPPPPYRRTAGDIMYLAVTTNEMTTVHITCSVTGFFISRSTNKVFDPTIKSFSGPTLPHVLSQLSPSFKTEFAKLQAATLKRHPHTYLLPSSQQAIPWLVQEPRNVPDTSRTLDVLVASADAADTLATRDWNEDLCSAAALPSSTHTEKVIRAQTLHRVYSEFVEAAIKGVTSIVQKSLAGALGDAGADGLGGQMFLHGGIFYSFAKDQAESFPVTGGAAAAHVAVSKDVDGVAKVDAVASGNWIGLNTLGTCVVDFKGMRVVAQTVVPGILNRQQGKDEASNDVIVYGSIDYGKNIVSQSEFHELIGKMGDALRIESHNVTDAAGVEHTLNTPVDVKGIVGNDGRKYVLDLGRLTPADIEFLDQIDASTDNGLPAYPHRLTLLRHELVDLYYEQRLTKFVTEQRAEIADRVKNLPEGEEAPQPELDLSAFSIKFNPDAYMLSPETEGAETEELLKQKENVRLVSKFLQETIIPAITVELGTNPSSVPLDGQRLTSFLHERGINMRYLGRIALSLEKLNSAPSYVKDLLVSEMIARAIKHVLRELLAEIPLYMSSDCIAHFLNCFFASKDTVVKANKPKSSHKEYSYVSLTPESLDQRIRAEIASRFRYPSENLPTHLADTSRKIGLLRSIALKVGIQLKQKSYNIFNNSKQDTIFESSDILNLCPVVKYPEPKSVFGDDVYEHALYNFRQGDKAQGQEYLREALNIYEQSFGPLHLDASKIQQNLARIHHENGELDLAKIYQRRALLIHERISGFDDPETLQQYLNLGFFECLTGNFSVGFDYMNHALKFFEMHCGTAVHPELAAADAQIAMLLAESKSDLPLGLKFLTRAIKTYEDVLGKEHDQTIRSYELYINQLIQLNDWERALEYQELVTASMKKRYTGDDEKSKNIVANAEKFVEFFKHKIQTEKAEKAGKAKAATEGAKKATPGSAKANKPKQAVPAVAKTIPSTVSKAPKGAATAADEVEPNKGHLSIDELMNFIDGSNGKKKGKKGKK
ncbi:hypothetical protein BCR33DRAFT_694296 [Rhizoclosmatium globosum]|uniref:Clu domain-containing protein n=1 Tax=Rhizoclosmatium globosum TaxID=329046 RepID=A0A1Y2CWS9_9FUNG|nr:hypothetical protein BCR33DRAFT_694296 [Rhizoclosmatium globosum]|eukprot:ORY51437.1 hypothetical protein BCR33DRAFT_694296 [Rhizoclosmatium globosum]